MKPLVIACGDHTGVGPEVTLKSVFQELAPNPPLTPGVTHHTRSDRTGQDPSAPHFVLVGDLRVLQATRQRLGLNLSWSDGTGSQEPVGSRQGSRVHVLDVPLANPDSLAPGSAASSVHALACLRRAAEGCLEGAFSALITGPVSKESILRAGVAFVGQTEFLAELAGHPEVTMMLLGDDDRGRWLRVALVTTHLPLRAVPAAIAADAVTRTIRHAAMACHHLGLPTQRIGVAGLNPHAGEGGMLGNEEDLHIRPGIQRAREEGIHASGPVAGDTLFHQALLGSYDAVVAMYHDQGLAPLKLVAFDRGVNWTLGLPFIRTSPDHGTAFDIAGRGIANATSMRSAIRLARNLAASRHQPDR